jgi:hypothetical protein
VIGIEESLFNALLELKGIDLVLIKPNLQREFEVHFIFAGFKHFFALEKINSILVIEVNALIIILLFLMESFSF